MRALAPVTRVEGDDLVVRTALTAADGTDLAPIEVRVATAHADLIDPTGTPGLPTLALLAALRGEDLVVEGPVDARAAAGAADLAAMVSEWWAGRPPVRVEVEETYEAPTSGDGVGLFFSRGVDSWSSLLDLLDEPPPDRVTHLLFVHHGPPLWFRSLEAEIIEGNRAVADELGLELVVVTTDARGHLDALRPWGDTFSPVTAACGLQVATGLRRLVMASAHRQDVSTRTGTDPALAATFGTSATEVVFGNPDRTRDERVAHILSSPLARRTLHVCWEGMTTGNCGRCKKCQLTLSSLVLVGDPDPALGFDHGPDPEIVRGLSLTPSLHSFVEGFINDLPPEHEELRRAWSDAWETTNALGPTPRWGDDAPPPLTGPSVPARVAAALRATTGQPIAPTPAPLGWRPGTIALRPAADRHDEVRARAAAAPERPRAWAVVEPHVRDAARDPHQVGLARLLEAAHGPGACYVPGILWAHLDPPVLGPEAVGRLLRTARVRAWWRSTGDLEPLRVVEAVEHGCLPLQVMPTGAAHDLSRALPSALAPLVVAADAIAALDLSPAGVAARLGPAVDHLLNGSAEHDLMTGAYR